MISATKYFSSVTRLGKHLSSSIPHERWKAEIWKLEVVMFEGMGNLKFCSDKSNGTFF
jgi:hypothetical protein